MDEKKNEAGQVKDDDLKQLLGTGRFIGLERTSSRLFKNGERRTCFLIQ